MSYPLHLQSPPLPLYLHYLQSTKLSKDRSEKHGLLLTPYHGAVRCAGGRTEPTETERYLVGVRRGLR
jgi:hypothetical protein